MFFAIIDAQWLASTDERSNKIRQLHWRPGNESLLDRRLSWQLGTGAGRAGHDVFVAGALKRTNKKSFLCPAYNARGSLSFCVRNRVATACSSFDLAR